MKKRKMGMMDKEDDDEDSSLLEKDTGASSPTFNDSDLDEDGMPPEPEVKGPLKSVGEYTAGEIAAAVMGGSAAGTAIANIILTGGIVVIIASALSVVMGGYLYFQTNKLVDIRTFREVQEYIQHQMEELKANNEKLDSVINGLSTNLEKLDTIKSTLETFQALGGESIDEFRDSIKTAKSNLKKRGQSLRTQIIRIVWDLMDTVDRDRDYCLGPEEVENLLLMLREISGIRIFEDRIREQFTNQPIDECEERLMALHDDEAPEDKILLDVYAA